MMTDEFVQDTNSAQNHVLQRGRKVRFLNWQTFKEWLNILMFKVILFFIIYSKEQISKQCFGPEIISSQAS